MPGSTDCVIQAFNLMATGEASTNFAVEDVKTIGSEWQRLDYQLRTARIKRMSSSL